MSLQRRFSDSCVKPLEPYIKILFEYSDFNSNRNSTTYEEKNIDENDSGEDINQPFSNDPTKLNDIMDSKLFLDKNNSNKNTIYFIKTTNRKKIQPKEKQIIFKIKKGLKKRKHLKKLGRKKKNEQTKEKETHNRNTKDNLIVKIKKNFIKSALKYINELYTKFEEEQKKSKKGKKTEPFLKILKRQKYTEYDNKKKAKAFLSMQLREIFEGDISRRNKSEKNNPFYNKKNINKLMEENKASEIINFLKLTVKEAYDIYIKENEEKIEGFNYLNNLPKKQENESEEEFQEYIELYKKKAKGFIEILITKNRKEN